jgi:5'-3' exonuclease
MEPFKVQAMVHSLKAKDEVTIISEDRDTNKVVAEYKGKKYTAIFNWFVGLYYVDNLYGEIKD